MEKDFDFRKLFRENNYGPVENTEPTKPKPDFVDADNDSVEKVEEVPKGCDLTKAEVDGLLSHLPTVSERENVQSAKEKLLKYREEVKR